MKIEATFPAPVPQEKIIAQSIHSSFAEYRRFGTNLNKNYICLEMNLLYQSDNFASYQCDRQRCFFLVHGDQEIRLSCCQLLALRQKVNAIDIETHFNGRNPSGIEILSLCNRAHLLVLNTLQLLELKDLIRASFGLLEINSLV